MLGGDNLSKDTSKTDRPKRKSRKMQIDAFNPDTWPADSKRRLEREMHIKDIMVGRKISNSPKAMYMEEFRLKDSDAYGKNVWMDEDILERVNICLNNGGKIEHAHHLTLYSGTTDNYNDLFLDINVAGTAPNVEPIDVLQTKYNQWKNSNISYCDSISSTEIYQKQNVEIHPNPTNDFISISNIEESKKIELFSLNGKFLETVKSYNFSLKNFSEGIYILKVTFKDRVEELKVIKH